MPRVLRVRQAGLRSWLGEAVLLTTTAAAIAGCSTTTAPDPARSTDLTRHPLVVEQAEQVWRGVISLYPDSVRPDARFERVVSREEQSQLVSECLNEEGWQTTADDDGIDSGNLTVEQEQSYLLANYACLARFPVSPTELDPLSVDEARALYEYFSGPLTKCLENEGVAVSAAPSFTVFNDSLRNEDSWTPYRDVPSDQSIDASELLAMCPQLPPTR